MVKSKSRDEAVNESFSENSLKMMRKRYLAIDPKTGKQETPADMLHRVAKSLAEVEKDYHHDASFVKKTEEDFFNIMASKEYTPAGRTMTNAGSDTALIANCIVLRIPDSMDGIFQTLKEAALLQQAGSGLGFALDELRPAMSTTKRSHGVSSGPVSFLKVYNEAFGTIKQQGRHGANMAMMSVDHPDVLDFIRSKEQEGAIANFNISVKVTDDFMNKLVKKPDTLWYCTFKGKKVKPHKVLRYPNGAVYGVEEIDITVGQLFDELVNYAWTNGEPGIVFIDKINHTNPLPGLGEIMSSNPCGEQFLHPYDNCNLGSLNLAEFVKNGKMDWPRLRFATRTAVRMMDNVIDKFDFQLALLG
ncbi:MAG: ribonucleotide-diphosphate reductase subunit alpha, partial [Patescibacteria group bacterium]|nr:ribonucleotide-diphosphate reductase subunit alpha [Patescibacteria group bacterium]